MHSIFAGTGFSLPQRARVAEAGTRAAAALARASKVTTQKTT